MKWLRRFGLALLVVLMLGAAVALFAFAEARRDPVVRQAAIHLPHWPAGAAAVRVVLLSDIHIGSRAMDGARLTRIVGQVNALHPDLVLIAGDFIAGGRPGLAAQLGPPLVPALRRLRARLGVVAVLGNHDHWTGAPALRQQLAAAGVTLLENAAVERGPLAIGGVGDAYTRHDRLVPTAAAVRRLPGAPVLLTHAPRVAGRLPADMPLLLAGHTHCGQIVLPLYGYADPITELEAPYFCGAVEARGHLVVVTAGLGTSGVPLRLGAPPDLWLLTLGP